METSPEFSFEGGCHCKAVSFSAKFPTPLSQLKVVSCNCTCDKAHDMILTRLLLNSQINLGSYCHIAGTLIAFVDDLDIQGTESLKVLSIALPALPILRDIIFSPR